MGFFRRRSVEKHRKPLIQFVCEQDGESERHLKSSLEKVLRLSPKVERAYLCRVSYGDLNSLDVALCVRCPSGSSRRLARQVHTVFASQFGSDQHLDIIFLADDQETDVAKVSKPFYQAV